MADRPGTLSKLHIAHAAGIVPVHIDDSLTVRCGSDDSRLQLWGTSFIGKWLRGWCGDGEESAHHHGGGKDGLEEMHLYCCAGCWCVRENENLVAGW